MQGVKSREYEVAESYFDDFSITVVLGRDYPDDKAFADKRGKEDIASGTCTECYFSIITNNIEQ